jgi:hypothetical protein
MSAVLLQMPFASSALDLLNGMISKEFAAPKPILPASSVFWEQAIGMKFKIIVVM